MFRRESLNKHIGRKVWSLLLLPSMFYDELYMLVALLSSVWKLDISDFLFKMELRLKIPKKLQSLGLTNLIIDY